MEIGKLPNQLLEKIILKNIKNHREEVLLRSAIGEDTAILDIDSDLCVLSTDPITGATKDIGNLAVHISCNDIATSGGEPVVILLSILAPPKTTREEIEEIMIEASKTAKSLNVEIAGGHTEITDAVNRIVINTTSVGRLKRERLPKGETIKPGDKLLITKYAGIEGTSILANELEETLLPKLGREKIEEAKKMKEMLSVIKEGAISGEIGVKYMHDITEGGVLGAVWEAAKASGIGIRIDKDKIPVKDVTVEIGEILDIDIYKLISSGSMIIIADAEKSGKIIERLKKEKIKCTVIGEMIEEDIVMLEDGELQEILPPASDELYRALSL